MLTRKIDRALDAMKACQESLPDLREVYRAGSPESVALSGLLEAVALTQRVLRREARAAE